MPGYWEKHYPGDGVNFTATPNSMAIPGPASVLSMMPCNGVNFGTMTVRHRPATL
ncbi:hypothetical protein [Sphingobium sp.]|uniref:hypothetical protein n=1 Tax=Sphingobium sp. TaxID=1912891 RepID=UPI002C5F9016|nr:hypothetical protein [Sphingobium sp.]HUD93532.1 hypothetical protein [Sphingobium sp.]